MAAPAQTAPLRILRRRQVEDRTGKSRSTIYAMGSYNPKRPNDYDPTFPKPIRIGAKAVGWIESEVDAWIAGRIAQSRDPAAPPPPRRKQLRLPPAVSIIDADVEA